MSIPRGLSAEEAAAWAHLAKSVTPLEGREQPVLPSEAKPPVQAPPKHVTVRKSVPPALTPKPVAKPNRMPDPPGLDSHWDRKLKTGRIVPDYTLDLHGHSLDQAYHRITSGLDQARAMQARVVLVIAGRSRPVDPADRAHKRGAIRSKLLDWIAAGPHASAIAAIRGAHRSHGGEGALYLILKRPR